jgi:hypothetical protein
VLTGEPDVEQKVFYDDVPVAASCFSLALCIRMRKTRWPRRMYYIAGDQYEELGAFIKNQSVVTKTTAH